MKSRTSALQKALRVLAVAVWAGIVLFALAHRQEFTVERILHFTPESPALAFLALMALFAFKSLTVVFYAGFLYASAGLLFPLPTAILASICGTIVMAAIPYAFARRIGADSADELREKHPRLRDLERLRSRSPFAFATVLRCVNVINFDVGSMYCGAVRLPLPPFLLGSVCGKLVDLVMWSVMGATLARRDPLPLVIMYTIDFAVALGVMLRLRRRSTKAA